MRDGSLVRKLTTGKPDGISGGMLKAWSCGHSEDACADDLAQQGRARKEGWIVFRVTPWAVLGPFPSFEDAAWRAESMGPHFLLAYGAREKGVPDFVPLEEPD